MSGYNGKDAARDTNATRKEVSRAWHDARDHAQKAGELPERAANKQKQAARQQTTKPAPAPTRKRSR